MDPNPVDYWWKKYLAAQTEADRMRDMKLFFEREFEALQAKVEALSAQYPMTIGRHFE